MSRTMRDVRHGGDINHRRNVRLWRTGLTQCRAKGATYEMAVISTTDVTCALGARAKTIVAHNARPTYTILKCCDVVFGLK
ncbi:hypothetical protein [Idiomarina sp.]|uniref:hypothetical protein n=1 Tax=Idiomarina sp. TaxID=1874361 RepID=UPI002EABC619|nr:hypothetical protein [Pseudomonadota bacterium]